jgi:alpha-tubulin suppressor-like RCC1 family protein
MASGGVKCWGWNGFGQLGDGTETDRLTPVEVIGLNDEITAIAAGDYHTCALTAAGGVKCWGQNEEGQLGDGAPTFKAVVAPVDAVGLSQGVTAITAGENHTCALLSSGEVKCWGWNHFGQLADGTLVDHSTPAGVINMGGVVAAIDSGQNYACSLTSSGGVNCWGENLMGQMGDGRLLWSSLPVLVVGLDNLQSR